MRERVKTPIKGVNGEVHDVKRIERNWRFSVAGPNRKPAPRGATGWTGEPGASARNAISHRRGSDRCSDR